MERTIIAWNLPNMITIPLMAAVGFLIAGIVWQLAKNVTGKGGNTPGGRTSDPAAADFALGY